MLRRIVAVVGGFAVCMNGLGGSLAPDEETGPFMKLRGTVGAQMLDTSGGAAFSLEEWE